jgi:dihydrofolate reductase
LDDPLRPDDRQRKKYVVSSTLDQVDWNAELVQGDLGKAVQQLKQEPGKGLFTGGVTLPLALADLGLIDEYEFVVQPILAGTRGRQPASDVSEERDEPHAVTARSHGAGRSQLEELAQPSTAGDICSEA